MTNVSPRTSGGSGRTRACRFGRNEASLFLLHRVTETGYGRCERELVNDK
jgi:hypothetical protein